MIKANDLRIGNWVINEMTGQNVSATAMTIFAVSNDSEVAREFYAIPLTPEILEKCGFVKDKEQPYGEGATLYTLMVKIAANNNQLNAACKHYNGDYSATVSYTVEGFWASNNIQYLHQLQNLYFALTGEELNVTFS